MEPTSHQPPGSIVSPTNSATDSQFSTTAAHATGASPYPTDSPAPPATSGVKAKLDSAVETSKKWLADSGVAEQAQQLPQKAKELGNKAWTSVSGLTTTQKAVGVGLLAAAVAFLATRGKKDKSDDGDYRRRPRRSPFDHQPSTRDGDHAYDRRGQRPWGASRYGANPAGPGRVKAGSGYSPAATSHGHSPDHGRPTSSDHSTRVGNVSPAAGPRRDQGPAAGSKFDAKASGGQNPNNLG